MHQICLLFVKSKTTIIDLWCRMPVARIHVLKLLNNCKTVSGINSSENVWQQRMLFAEQDQIINYFNHTGLVHLSQFKIPDIITFSPKNLFYFSRFKKKTHLIVIKGNTTTYPRFFIFAKQTFT